MYGWCGAGGHTVTDQTVLVVEDEPDIAELYVGLLGDQYDVRTVGTVEAALETLDEAVDVVLLDRRLPDGRGGQVLTAIRDRHLDCRVAMVTAVEPDFDIIDMGFDLYITKPVTGERLRDAVDTLQSRNQYDAMLRKAAALATKRAVLEAEKPPNKLEKSDRYQQLLDELNTVDADLSSVKSTFTSEDYRVLFRDIGQA